QSWMQNEIPVIVATTAFGMGIDKPDVRLVLHYDAPEHLEAYYQEAGRAGRDSQPSNALLLYNSSDIQRLSDSIALQFPPEAYLRKVYQAVTEYLQIPIGNQPDQYYPFDLADFCKNFKLQATEASYALRLLEQENLWTLTEAVFNPATIQFITDRYTLDNICKLYPNLGYIITNLLRMHGTIFQYPTTIRLSAISKQLKLKREEIEASLQQLRNMQILEYNTPSEGPQLFFHHLRVDSRHLIIDMKRISVLRKRHETRTNAMMSFLKNENECRERIILNYFGENVQADCGHCDICLKKKTDKKIDKKELQDIVDQTLRQIPNITLQQLINDQPIAIREQLIALVRGMIDDKTLTLSENGQITKPNK
ncbi:MAG TPA: C-terminal helicase domain-containing protein, partial [Flavipsychrobacter sp.]|nr:C-terminal helicase domain-containing protein [Flavipsychrobacter sp.]